MTSSSQKLQYMSPIKFPTKCVFPNFYILKINGRCCFVIYLWNDPRITRVIAEWLIYSKYYRDSAWHDFDVTHNIDNNIIAF